MVESISATGTAKPYAGSKKLVDSEGRRETVPEAHQRCFQPLSSQRGQVSPQRTQQVQECLHLTPRVLAADQLMGGKGTKDCSEFLWSGQLTPSPCTTLSPDHRLTLSPASVHTPTSHSDRMLNSWPSSPSYTIVLSSLSYTKPRSQS